MKLILIAASAALLVVGGADARSHGHASSHHSYSHHSYSHRSGHHSSGWHHRSGAVHEGELTTSNHYTNVSGHNVHGPSRTRSGARPSGATAHCSDGTWSFSEHARGTCSHHGGIG